MQRNLNRDFIQVNDNLYFKNGLGSIYRKFLMQDNKVMLSQCYQHFCGYKDRMYNYCRDLAYLYKAKLQGIMNYNKREFTYGMYFTYNKKSYFAYITPNHNYLLELE